MKIILGKGKTLKSSNVFELINKDIEENKNVILFVPSQIRTITEENYINVTGSDGIIDLNITTISSYIDDFLSDKKLNKEKKVSKLDKKILLYKVILENNKLFKIFKKVKNKEGFLTCLFIYFDIFKKQELNLEDLKKEVNENIILKNKVEELVSIYEVYENEYNDKYIDSYDEFDIFLKLFDFSNISVYFDGYNNFTHKEFKFIKLLLKLNVDITLSLTTDILEKFEHIEDLNKFSSYISNDNINIFSVSNLTLYTLIKMCKKNDVNIEIISKLSYAKYRDENLSKFIYNFFENIKCDEKFPVNINLKTNPKQEIISIARDIRSKINKGYKFDDFVIYTSNIDEYYNIINRIFSEYDLKFYIDRKESLSSNILYKYVTYLLDLSIYGYDKDILFEILKTRFLDIDITDINLLENYVLEFNINRYTFVKPFTKNSNYDLERLNNIRENIIEELNIVNKFKDSNIKDIATLLYNFLKDKGALEKYSNMINELKLNEDVYSIYYANLMNVMYNKIFEVIDRIITIYNDIDLKHFIILFKNICLEEDFKYIKPTIDSISVLDLNVSKILPKKQVYFIGVNESKFISASNIDPLFSDEDLETLSSKGFNIKETSTNKIYMQLFNFYEALCAATEEVSLSYTSSDNEGNTLIKSNIISKIEDLFNIKVLGSVVNNDIGICYTNKECLEVLLSDNDNKEGKLAYLLNKTDLKHVLKYNRNENEITNDKKEIITSVSKLETFKSCNFKYFLKYVLKVEKRKLYEITSLDTGSFMHEVIDKFSKYLFDRNINYHEILLEKDKYIKILDDIIEEIFDKLMYNLKDNIKFNIEKTRLKNAIYKVIFTIATSFNQSKFVPLGHEIEFKEGKDYLPIEIDLDDDRKMKIIGKVDRVDKLISEDKEYIRIIDYKSSDKNLVLKDIKEGISLQLITYLSAIIENEKNKNKDVIPAAMLYFNLSNKIVNSDKYYKDEKLKKDVIKALRMKGIFLKDLKIIELMDNKLSSDERLIDIAKSTVSSDKETNKALDIESFNELCLEVKDILKDLGNEILKGSVKINPIDKACDFCDYSSICRKINKF